MKTSNKILIYTGIVVAVTLISIIVTMESFVTGNMVKGSGKLMEKEFVFEEPIDKIAISSLPCDLVKSNVDKVVVTIDDNLMEKVIVKVDDGELKISKANGSYYSDAEISVKVYYSDLAAINVVAAGQANGEISRENLKLAASSAGELNLDLTCDELSLHLTSGAEAKLKGTSNFVRITGGSGADLDAKNLQVNNCVARIGSGMDVDISVGDTLVADVSSGADLTYFGSPYLGNINIGSGGDLNHGND